MVVEATLVVVQHGDHVTPAGQRFAGFTELRLTDAVVVAE
jgi:hypothetical protein